jgi:hypothetical protein
LLRRREPSAPLPPRVIPVACRRISDHEKYGVDLRNQMQVLKIVGMFLALSAPAWIIALLFTYEGYDYILPLMTIPILLLPVVMLVSKTSSNDSFLRMIMFVALGAKLAACGGFMYLAFNVYNGSADSLHFGQMAETLARGFTSFDQAPVLYPFWSTNFVIMLISWVYIAFGVSFQTVTVLFAMIGYAGQFFLYRAFRTAFPDQEPYTFAMMVFLLPSIVFWSAPAGKDAIILLGVGLTSYGFALLNKHGGARGYLIVAAGLGVCMLVRPHIALLLALSLVIPYVFGEHLTGTSGMILKVATLPVFAYALFYLASQASTFLSVSDFSQTRQLAERVGDANATGGSSFGSSSISVRLLLGPFLIFRPFPWEVRNFQSAIASLEAAGLALYCYRRRYNLIANMRFWRKNAFVGFVVCYSFGFIVVFSAAMTNLGLLARQRIMMVPVALMVFAASLPRIERSTRTRVTSRFMPQFRAFQDVRLADPNRETTVQ